MSLLRRKLAPISSEAWSELDEQARRVLKTFLAGRKLVDFDGPLGLEAAALNLGRLETLKSSPAASVEASRRMVQPLIELRVPFSLSRAEIDAIDRGAKDPDVKALEKACQQIARAEDVAVFHGYDAGGIAGIAGASPHKALTIPDRYEEYPRLVSDATRRLREAGVDGPYGIALGPRCYAGLMQATEHGYPVLELVRRSIDGALVWAPAVDGAVVLSTRGGDFELTVGQDLAIGYTSHDEDSVELFVTETFTFRVLTPEAGIALRYGQSSKKR